MARISSRNLDETDVTGREDEQGGPDMPKNDPDNPKSSMKQQDQDLALGAPDSQSSVVPLPGPASESIHEPHGGVVDRRQGHADRPAGEALERGHSRR